MAQVLSLRWAWLAGSGAIRLSAWQAAQVVFPATACAIFGMPPAGSW
jgi:hypothetical protein